MRATPTYLLLLLAAACGGPVSAIPDRTVVLTFDDCSRTHLTYVAPLLSEYGFRATFFATGAWRDRALHYLSFAEIAELSRMGFEVGSHSFGHHDFGDPANAALLPADLDRLDGLLAGAGIPRPRSFAWPADCFGPEARAILAGRGIAFARRGTGPDFPPGRAGAGRTYDPTENDPLLVPTTATVTPEFTLDMLGRIVRGATDGRAAVLQFHGVPDLANPRVSTPPELFRRFLDLLVAERCTVVALGDLARWVSPRADPGDPLATIRYEGR